MRRLNPQNTGWLRRGFSLVELLMVIVIIGLLLGLTLRIVGAFVTQARHSATDATIRKVQALLNARAEALQRLMKRTGYIESRSEYSTAKTILEGINVSDLSLQKTIATKLIQQTYFPQRKVEVSDSQLYPGLSSASSLNSSEILYNFLTQSNVLGDLQAGTDAFSTTEVVDIDNNGFPEFVDAWGNRLRFYRWPTRLFRPGGWTNPAPTDVTADINTTIPRMLLSTLPSFSGNLARDLARDPDDPLRRCGNTTRFPSFETLRTGFPTPVTYHVMLVVSAGPDGVLGMYEPEDAANNGHLGAVRMKSATEPVDEFFDDITFLKLRVGGQ